jgi:uncharacterized protein YbaA (DUF1428 family)
MTYIEGFITPVPLANQAVYLDHARDFSVMLREYGGKRLAECWEDDVPDGKVTDFRRAVQAEDGEAVVLSWFEFADKAARDASMAAMMKDPRMEAMGSRMPFDGRRMIYGGFEGLVERQVAGRQTGYVDGFVLAVPTANRETYRELASVASEVFLDNGACRVVEAWGDDVPEGKRTDFRRAVKAEPAEAVVYSVIEWPSREVRDRGWKQAMQDDRMQEEAARRTFDGQRMFWGGFKPLLDLR